MLGKMVIHGLIAAALIGSAAAVYARAKDNGDRPFAATDASGGRAGDRYGLRSGRDHDDDED